MINNSTTEKKSFTSWHETYEKEHPFIAAMKLNHGPWAQRLIIRVF